MPKGEHLRGHKPANSGRKKGVTPSKDIQYETATETLKRLGLNTIEQQALIAIRRVPCGTCIDKDCKPTGKTFYKMDEGKHSKKCAVRQGKECDCEGIASRQCQSCWGTLWEQISISDMNKALTELNKYAHAQMKAIELSGLGGGPIQHEMVAVEFLKAKRDDDTVS